MMHTSRRAKTSFTFLGAGPSGCRPTPSYGKINVVLFSARKLRFQGGARGAVAWCVQRYLAFRFCNFALSDVPWYDYISPPQRPNPTDEDGSSLKDPAVIPRAQLGFSFLHLGAVLDFFLPEVGHAQQCRCVFSKEYFRPSASTAVGMSLWRKCRTSSSMFRRTSRPPLVQ